MDANEQHARVLFWERSLHLGRPCRMCGGQMFHWHDIRGAVWELCKTCDVGGGA